MARYSSEVVSSLTLEYVKVRVSFTKNNVYTNPTGDVVQFAFPAVGVNPVTWYSGSWETDTDTLGTTIYVARCNVGPSGTVALSAGTYDVWVKVTDNPEVPVVKVGELVVQ